MASLAIGDVTKRFGAVEVLSRVTLDVKDGEFVAILGPSGCGKTTLLRIVAGFEDVQGGTVSIGAQTVSSRRVHVPPERRNVGIVFNPMLSGRT